MSARIYLVLSAAFVGAICSVAQSAPGHADPLKTAAVNASGEAGRSWNLPAPRIAAHASKARSTPVASATRKLDLSKLTMADFGDVDSSR